MKFFAWVINLIAKIFFRKKSKLFKKLLSYKYRTYQKQKLPVSEIVIKMLIVAEDHRFFKHGGVDFIAIVRAITRTYLYGKTEGGSTIEQQLVRTITGNYQKTFRRKLEEICLACLVSDVVKKSKIPGFYLSLAYYGYNMNGYAQAVKRMGINYNLINAQDAVRIISRLKYPEPAKKNQKRNEQIRIRENYI